MAAEQAKADEWKENGVDTSEAVIAVKDTHPSCRYANTVEQVDGKPVVKFTPAPMRARYAWPWRGDAASIPY